MVTCTGSCIAFMRGEYSDMCVAVLLLLMCTTRIGLSLPRITEYPIDTLAVAGYDAQLNCSAENILFAVKWFLLNSNRNQLTEGTASIRPEHYKVVGNVDQGEYNLYVSNTTTDLGALYSCVVQITHSEEVIGEATLYIIDTKPICSIHPGLIVIERKIATLNCTVEDGVPPGESVWTMDDTDVSRKNTSEHLFMTSFTRYDNGTVFNCGIRHSTLSSEEESQLMCENPLIVEVQYPAIVNITRQKNNAVVEGDDYFAECEVQEKGNPDVIVRWYWYFPNGTKHDNGTLYLTDVGREANGTYTCVAENTYYDNSIGYGNATVDLNIHYEPEVTIHGDSNGKVVEGKTYTAECMADANPAPTFFWTDPNGVQLSDNSILELKDIRRESENTYTCHARNEFFNGQQGYGNSSVDIDIQYNPVVETLFHGDASDTGQIIEGNGISIECVVIDANPVEVTISWQSQNASIYDNWMNFTTVSRERHGDHICVAKNTFWDGSHGSGMANVSVDVQYSPEIKLFEDVTYVIEEMMFHKICEVSGNPKPDVRWKYNDNQVSQTKTIQYEDIQRHQSGIYVCEANNTFWNGELAVNNGSFYLNVQYPPTIVVTPRHVCREQESINFTCNAIDANPLDTMYTWLSVDGKMTQGGLLPLHNVTRDKAGIYTCIGNNMYYNGEQGTGSNRTYFDVQYGPEVKVDEPNLRIREGTRMILTCTANSNPPVYYHVWTKDGLIISSNLRYSVELVNRSDAGTYYCTAETTFYNDDVDIGYDMTHVVVEYLPIVDIIGPSAAAEEGKTQVTVTCTVTDGVPDPTSLILLHVNESVNQIDNVENQDGITSHTFDLGVMQRWNNGSYYCEANTKFADQSVESAISKKIPIIVHYKPSISGEDKETMDVPIGSSVSLSCTVDAYPDANVTWKKDDKNLDVGEDSSTFAIISAIEDDGGKYICTAENNLGKDQREIELKVILSDGYTVVVPVVSTLSVIVLLAVLVVVVVVLLRNRKRKLVRDRRLEGETDPQYQELDLQDIPQASVYTTLEQYASLSNTKSDTNTEYVMPGEIVLEFPKEYVRQKDLIGEGTFGRVFKAEAWELCDRDGVTVVALKTIKDNATEDDKQKLTDELELLKTIGQHKNILSLVGYCTKTEPVYLLLDYMTLGNLQKYLRDFRKSNTDNYANAEGKLPSLSSGDLLSFARQTASAMVYLTSKKVIHGELAARNVMLNDDKICKVTNFGRDLNNLKGNVDDNKMRLPVRWMAPEVLWSSEFSIESDVWSFGVVVWEIVTLGNTPYQGMSAKEVIVYLKQGSRMSRPKYCNEDLYLLMMNCWSQKPTRRPKFKDLVRELEEMEYDKEVYVDINSAIDDVQEDVKTIE